jgi:hypothetical protein
MSGGTDIFVRGHVGATLEDLVPKACPFRRVAWPLYNLDQFCFDELAHVSAYLTLRYE